MKFVTKIQGFNLQIKLILGNIRLCYVPPKFGEKKKEKKFGEKKHRENYYCYLADHCIVLKEETMKADISSLK